MTDETFESTPTRPRARAALRFATAFLVGLILAMALGVGALYAYDQQYQGRRHLRYDKEAANTAPR